MDIEQIDVISVRFEDRSLAIQYQMGTDVRRHMIVSSSLMLDRGHPDYGDDYENLLHKVRKIVANALEDFADSEPYLPEADDEDNEKGMGE